MERLAVSLVSTNYIKEEQEVAAEIVKCPLKGYNAKKLLYIIEKHCLCNMPLM